MTDRREQSSRGAVAFGEPGGELGAYQDLANDHQGDTAAPHQMQTACTKAWKADSATRRKGESGRKRSACTKPDPISAKLASQLVMHANAVSNRDT